MLQADAKMGRLNIITTMGDANNDGKYEELFALVVDLFLVFE
jgi:hypothetical protein